MLLYKYVAPERIDVLENSRIRFTQPDQLNDPFESRPNMTAIRDHYRAIFMERYPQLGVDQIDQCLETLVDSFPSLLGNSMVVLSLSRTPSNQLMWSHYGDSHKGFVIGFDPDSDFFSSKRVTPTDVNYAEQRTNVAVDKSDEDLGFLAGNKEFLLTKSQDWEYEEEVRVIADPKTADINTTIDNNIDLHLFEFPVSAVREVIVGCNTTPNIESRIRNLVDSKYRDALILKANLNEREFKMDIEPAPTPRPAANIPIFLSILPPIGEEGPLTP